MKLIISATVEGISTRQDGTVSIKIGSQELDSSHAANLFEFRNKFVKVLISDNGITAPEEALINETKLQDGRKIKTKSARLRATLFRVWEANGMEGEFDAYYNTELEKLIDHYKKKLE